MAISGDMPLTQARATFDHWKTLVRANIAGDVFDHYALPFIFEPRDKVEAGLKTLRHDFADELVRTEWAPSQAFASSYAYVFAEIARTNSKAGTDGKRPGMKTFSLSDFAAHCLTMAADVEHAKEVAVERACVIVEKEAKKAIGTYRYGWTPLKPSTITRKWGEDTPLLATGEMRRSIGHVVWREGKDVIGEVGSNNMKAAYHELGTSYIPPRSFLMGAAMRKEAQIQAMTQRLIISAMVRGGPHYRELHELFHLAHRAYEAWGTVFDDLREQGGGDDQR